jgi:hypothetical protein
MTSTETKLNSKQQEMNIFRFQVLKFSLVKKMMMTKRRKKTRKSRLTISQQIQKLDSIKEVLDNRLTTETTDTQHLMPGVMDPSSLTPMPELVNGGRSR